MAGERGPRWTEPGSDATPRLRELLKREQDDVPSDARLRELASKIANSLGDDPAGSVGSETVDAARDQAARGRPISARSRFRVGLGVLAVLVVGEPLRDRRNATFVEEHEQSRSRR